MQDELDKVAGLRRAINKAIEIFTTSSESTFDEVMSNGLIPIAEALRINRIVVYTDKNAINLQYESDKEPQNERFGQVYRWDKDGGGLISVSDDLCLAENNDVVSGWMRLIRQNKYIFKQQKNMTDAERFFLRQFGVTSIFFAPIFQRGKFWGMVTFQDHVNDSNFADNCEDFIIAAGQLCVGAIIRETARIHAHSSYESLKISKGMTDTLNNAAVLFLSLAGENFEQVMTHGMNPIADLVDVDRLSVWRNFDAPNGLHSSQIYRWDRYSGGTTEPTKKLIDVSYAQFAPRWESLLRDGGNVNSPVSLLPEKEMLESFGVVSCFVTPIFVDAVFWGFVIFEDRKNERYFKPGHTEMMHTAALLCANAVMRRDMEHNLEKTNELLKMTLDKATAASLAKSTFLSNMSHEMRTPLNTIIGMASIGKNATDYDRKDYTLGKIEEASQHLLGVINDVLDMSKIEANKLELINIDFSFEKMLKKAVNAVCIRMEEKRQNFLVNIDGRIPHIIVCDDMRLTQVIINLLSNAVKFTPENGNITLDARLIDNTAEQCVIEIKITDTGIGMSPEQMGKLFTAFEQADGSMSRKFGGTGLGLTISKRIIGAMGGEINCVSTPDIGTTFTFTFKAICGKERVELLDPSVNWENMTVLVVDDSKLILEYFAAIFGRFGVKCDVAESGAQALELIEKNGCYDMYFIDWQMPLMDGIELTKRVKDVSDKKSVVIMISAAEWVLIKDKATEAGVDKHLSKPIFASDVVDCMNVCLGMTGNITPKQKKAVRRGEFAGCRILLAEDVEINREILLACMEPTGAVIDCAVNGLEAVEMYKANPDQYDLIFMDVQMPEMDGLAATKEIRKMGGRVPIIAMTANVFKEDIEKCLGAGMDDHIGKPLDMVNVIRKTKKYWK